MDLTWKTSLSATALHAAACFHEGLPVADVELAPVLGEPIELLVAELHDWGLPAAELLGQLAALASEVENNRQLVEQASTRLWGKGAVSESMVALMAGRIADLEAALLRTRPQLAEEMELRSRPLCEQWEAHGPGLLNQMTLLSEDGLLVPSAEVVLVAPIVGGHGRAHLTNNRVTFEAVLVNPQPRLPETVRLAWLLAQLNQDLPIYSEQIPRLRLPLVASLASVPLALAAAEQLELVKLDAATVAGALGAWHLPSDLPADLPARLLDWWSAYDGSTTRWAVALAALDVMLQQ